MEYCCDARTDHMVQSQRKEKQYNNYEISHFNL